MKRLLLLLTCAVVVNMQAAPDQICCTEGRLAYPSVAFRSQGVDAARELVTWQEFINRPFCADECWYNVATVDVGYSQSFSTQKINKLLLGDDKLIVTGSLVPQRGTYDVLADYFGLPFDFNSELSLYPRIRNVVADFNFYTSKHFCHLDWYFRVHLPLVHTSWQTQLCENVIAEGTRPFPAGYVADKRINRADLPTSMAQALAGDVRFGDMQEALAFGKISAEKQGITRLADVHLAVGANWINDEDAHAGFNLRLVIPTGNKPTGEYLFEPIVGNGRHVEVGVGFSGHTLLSECEDAYWELYADINMMHFLRAKRCYNFDLVNSGCGSRYVLLQQFRKGSENLFAVINQNDDEGATPTAYQYEKSLVPAINRTTLPAEVEIDYQVDAAFKLAYREGCWGVDLGYNLWARSSERVIRKGRLEENRYAVKGDAMVYGFNLISEAAVPLNATQHAATLYRGQGATNFIANAQFVPGGDIKTLGNYNADNAATASDATGILLNVRNADLVILPMPATDLAHVSFPEMLLQDAGVVSRRVTPGMLTHKFFASLNYFPQAECDTDYFFGLGGSVECADVSRNRLPAVSQWAVWIKGGVAF